MPTRPQADGLALHPLAWLAGAVAGRPLRVAPLPSGQASYTDGATIHLDASLPHPQQRCVVMAHSLLLAAGSLAPAITRHLRLRPTVSQRYFGLELQRAAVLLADRLPPGFAAQAGLVAVSPSQSARESYALALAGRQVDCPAWLGQIRPSRVQPDAAMALAPGQARRAAHEDSSEDDQALSPDDLNLLEKFRTPLSSGLGFADTLLRLLDFRRGSGPAAKTNTDSEDDGAAALAQTPADHSDSHLPQRSVSARARANTARLAAPGTRALHYPEWDESRQAYRPNHVRVSEIIPLPEEDTGTAPSPAVALPGLGAALARIGVRYQHVRGRNKGEDLDLDALIDVSIQRRSGHSMHENIYIATEASRRDLSVLLLLDISRSTADRGDDGLTVLQRHGSIALQLTDTFERLGDHVASYGFHSWGRERVRFVRLKAFTERATVSADRIAALTPSGLTRLGAAIRHGTALLGQNQHHTHRLMLMLTDGFAYDDGYEGRYARADTARALAEATAAGIACVCVNIGTDQDDATLRQLYGEAAYLRSANTTGIVGPLRQLMHSALYRASLARMRRQVTEP